MDIETFERAIFFKTALIEYLDDHNGIIELYQDSFQEPFKEFVDDVTSTIESDPSFILQDSDLTDLILTIINEIRSEKNSFEDYDNDQANEIIRYINLHSRHISYEEREKIRKNYCREQGKSRHKRYKNRQDMYFDILNDYPVYNSIFIPEELRLYIGDFDEQEYKQMVESHTAYFLDKCPSLSTDEYFKYRTIEIIGKEKFNSIRRKQRIKTIKKQMNNFKK